MAEVKARVERRMVNCMVGEREESSLCVGKREEDEEDEDEEDEDEMKMR